MVATESIGVLLTAMVNIEIKKQDLSKYKDLANMGFEIASMMGNEEMAGQMFFELHGYPEEVDVPEYRIIKDIPIRMSITDMTELFDRHDQDLDSIVKLGEKKIDIRDCITCKKKAITVPVACRLLKFKYLLSRMDDEMWRFIGNIMKSMGVEERPRAPELPMDALKKLPKELQDMLGGLTEGKEEEEEEEK